jgi:hypothetical protein
MTPATTTTVTQSVTQTSDIIYVADASGLSIPNFAANMWGVVMIEGERIMYREIDLTANTISSLLRGTAGTAAAPHAVGAIVYNSNRDNLMPEEYQNYIVSNVDPNTGKYPVADGSETIFVAADINLAITGATIWTSSSSYVMGAFVYRNTGGGFYYRAKTNVPTGIAITNTTYWQPLSAAVEVYVGGTRQTSGYTITVENPVHVTFAIPPTVGSAVAILVRRGVTWYNPGPNSASDGVPLQETINPGALFLQGKN